MEGIADDATSAQSLADLAGLLRALHRRQARERARPPRTYRALAGRVGCSHGLIGEYFTGKVLPPSDRFDELVRELGATPPEQRLLASARDRVEDAQRARRRRLATPPPRPTPRQLPRTREALTGRASELTELDAALGPHGSGLALLVGPAGIGKTSLALAWAHGRVGDYPDGQLFVDLAGFSPGAPLEPGEILAGFLDALGMAPDALPDGLSARAASLRSVLAGLKVLLVLDNARDAAQVRPLLPGAPGCGVIVTRRTAQVDLVAREGAVPVHLDYLDRDDSRRLLRDRLGTGRLAAAGGHVETVLDACAGLPLALATVAARAALSPAGTLDPHPLSVVTGTRSDLSAVLDWGHDLLTDRAATAYRLLSIHDADVTTALAASLLGVPVARAREVLDDLALTYLVDRRGADRWRMHDVVRAHAAARLRSHEPAAAIAAAEERYLGYWAMTATAAARRLDAKVDLGETPATAGVVAESLADLQAAVSWFTASLARLLGPAGDEHARTATTAMAASAAFFLSYAARYREAEGAWRTAIDMARRAGRPRQEAIGLWRLSVTLLLLGRQEDALATVERADELCTAIGDDHSLGLLHFNWGLCSTRPWAQPAAGDFRAHFALAERALRRADRPDLLARLHNAWGYCLALAGEVDEAERLVLAAQKAHESIGEDDHGTAMTWDSLGTVRRLQGRLDEALAAFLHAAELTDAPGICAGTWEHIAETFDSQGEPEAAAAARETARSYRGDVGGDTQNTV